MLSETKYSLRSKQPNFTASKTKSDPVDRPNQTNVRSATSADASVGCKIKKLRWAAGHTQKQMADLVGVTGAQFHRYEAGTTRIAASRLIDIATALGVRAEVLIGDADASTAPPASLPLSLGDDATNDLVELVQLFSEMSDPRRSRALIAFARALATNRAADEAGIRDAP